MSCKFSGVKLVDVVSGLCAMGLGTVMGPVARGDEGFCDASPLAGTGVTVKPNPYV